MKKYTYAILGLVFASLCYLIFVSANIVFSNDIALPKAKNQTDSRYRLVLITRDMDTTFWNKVGMGASRQAVKEGASLEIWGSYSNNSEQFLKKLELAIHSKVDGIIIQGLDTDEFKELTKVKAAFNGIPIITVANDVPMKESLRRTYVGSDQFRAGGLIARQLLNDMGTEGKVVLLSDEQKEYYQNERLKGIYATLKVYPNIKIQYAETGESKDQVITTMRDQLNQIPDVNGFIAVNAKMIGPMVQEIGKRSQVEPYFIYTFDDGPESLPLFEEGKIDGVVEQDPETMGEVSVQQIVKWLNGETVPLDINGYFTNIRILKDNRNE
ncbi:sugar ABC transporter substrate-binding protein [Bacillus sp. ISL-35]|uniref:sugar ABC transporter substrate-binding protein n=1 Tax=Bacillus sp. ISL-35 TaxID=2819122 RepID=UPI001BEBE85E|nr:sugar ABC transporter substrate-binding protein [Bacillus sp. ISL-35]MBT2680374.1 sugar ABC transporter substrate-binding protein [Bacillus sp. ISL-35]MBT2704334.1 sugar ABC transporter substrate-binding protein [Chryseobacterium sp. ISL-80]